VVKKLGNPTLPTKEINGRHGPDGTLLIFPFPNQQAKQNGHEELPMNHFGNNTGLIGSKGRKDFGYPVT